MAPFTLCAGIHRARTATLTMSLASLMSIGHEAAATTANVSYVPIPYPVVERMLEMAKLQPDDHLIDLGSGDGRIAIAAVKNWNAGSALGIDLDMERIAEARQNAERAGVADRVRFEQGDLLEADLSEASVLTVYQLNAKNIWLQPVILKSMNPGTRVLTHSFELGEWEPDQSDTVEGGTVHMWTVPATVGGKWQLTTADGTEALILIEQSYQRVVGSAEIEGEPMMLAEPRLNGNEIRFSIDAQQFVGRVEGDQIVPAEGANETAGWNAQRI
ncbi:SAM-dependent methyltransferase [Pseudomonas saliphila]|uniref:SAM-dependent methyltransferase n=1 Tax=Pseudomonas saliphila TaxID=2586906 RepID=UPI00123882C2|nr:class I SAM-dependent methyltransferase [Pseudomonas saliphila]